MSHEQAQRHFRLYCLAKARGQAIRAWYHKTMLKLCKPD